MESLSLTLPLVLPSGAAPYVPRRALGSPLHRLVREHGPEFVRYTSRTYTKGLPKYVRDEFNAFLRCGDFAHGFVRSRCERCGHDLLVPFSCKRRGICPSCAGRRMSNTAAHLVDRVLPDVPLRQWVLTLPWEIRRLAAFRAEVAATLARRFVLEVFRSLRRAARSRTAAGGAVCFVQRAGGSLNLNVHFHVLVLDGVYQRLSGEAPVFEPLPPPSREPLAEVARRTRAGSLRWLRRRGFVVDDASDRGNEPPALEALAECSSAALSAGTFARVDDDGSVRPPDRDERRFGERPDGRWTASCDGFDVHAGVRIDAGDDAGRERLCRYVARPGVVQDRFRELPDGRMAYRVKWSRKSSTTHRVMSPVEALARLAALVPPPRYPLVRYHGVLAPASRWRRFVVPLPRDHAPCRHRGPSPADAKPPSRSSPAEGPAPPAPSVAGEDRPYDVLVKLPEGHEASRLLTLPHWSRLLDGLLCARSPRLDWATLLRRTFGADALECPVCRGRLRPLDVVTDREEAVRVAAALAEACGDDVGPATRSRAAAGPGPPAELFDPPPPDEPFDPVPPDAEGDGHGDAYDENQAPPDEWE